MIKLEIGNWKIKILLSAFCLLPSAFLSAQTYYPSVSTKGTVSDGMVVVFDGASGKYIKSSGSTNAGAYIDDLAGTLGNLQTNINTASNALRNATGLVQTNFNNGSNDLRNAIGLVQTNFNNGSNDLRNAIGTVQTNVNTANNSIGTVQTNFNNGSNDLRNAIGLVQTNFDNGSNDLRNAIGAVQTNVNTASNVLNAAFTNYQVTVAASTNDLASDIAALQLQVGSVPTNQASTNASLQAQISAEYTRATNAEAGLQITIDAAELVSANEIARATNAEAVLQSNIDAADLAIANEISRATNAEAGLQINIDALNTTVTNANYKQGLTNAMLSAQIGTNTAFNTAQGTSNAMFSAQIGTNTAFNVAQALSNAMYSAWFGTNASFHTAQGTSNAMFSAWIGTSTAFNVAQALSNAMLSAQIGTNTAFNVAQALSNAMYSAQIGTNTAFNVAQALSNAMLSAQIGTNTAFNVAQALSNAMYSAWFGTNASFHTSQGTSNTMFSAWIKTNTDFNTVINTNTLKLAGGIMEGPATNEFTWYGKFSGDGNGLTNLSGGVGGNVYTASNNVFTPTTTQSFGRIKIDDSGGSPDNYWTFENYQMQMRFYCLDQGATDPLVNWTDTAGLYFNQNMIIGVDYSAPTTYNARLNVVGSAIIHTNMTVSNTVTAGYLRLSGGSPDVRYRLQATNNLGQTKWSRGRTSFFATAPAERIITAGNTSNMVYATIVTNDGLTYDTGTGEVTLPIGHWIVGAVVAHKTYTDVNSGIQAIIEKNNSAYVYSAWVIGNSLGYYLPAAIDTSIYSDGDDKVNAAARGGGTYGATNYSDSTINQFWIEYQGE
jgi:hypothetical protein